VYQLLRFAAFLVGIVAVTSCQVIADIESYEPDPLPDTCKLPEKQSGGGKVRLVHLLPTDSAIDICLRPAGGSYGRPVLRSSGTGKLLICGAGLKYSEATIVFGVPTGTLDFKVIPATKTCSAPALAEKTGVEVTPDLTVTVAYMGPPEGQGAPTLQAMYEKTNIPGASQNRFTRFINAIAGSQLDWGASDGVKTLPADIQFAYFNAPMGFAQLPRKGQVGPAIFSIDDYGYAETIQNPIPTGATPTGEKKMILIGEQAGAGAQTYYAIGYAAPGSAWPVRGLICKEQSETTGGDQKQDCTLTAVEMFKIDLFNAGLYGAFATVEAERGAAVIQKLAQRGSVSDFLCVSEVSRHDSLDIPVEQKAYSQDALKRAALLVDNGFKHFAQAETNLDTQPDEPVDQKGNIPPPVTRAPCSAPVTTENLDRAYKCLIDKCSSTPGNPDGVTAGGTNCYSQNCGAAALGFLLFGSPEDHQCFNCIVLNGLSYIPWSRNRTRCTTEARRPLGFEGKATSMLLSRLPLRNVEQYVMGTSAFRRVGLYANVDLGQGNDIDVYCIHMPPLLGGNIPYAGDYGADLPPTTGVAWSEEQVFASKKIIDWVKRRSEGRRAIIMGDWSSSSTFLDANGRVAVGADGLPLVGDVTPETTRNMKEAFVEAVPPGFVPKCTRCPAGRLDELRNIYNVGVTDPIWNLRVYIKDPWGPNITEDARLFFHEPSDYVTYTKLTDFGPQGPASDSWGFHVEIRR
jgi:hypothetical protein